MTGSKALTPNADRFTPEIRERIKALCATGRCPIHVAIIMDGNGRWARQRELERNAGHNAGVKTVKKVVEVASEMGVSYLTLYTFSVENWKRPLSEVQALMALLSRSTMEEIDDLMRNNVRLIATGRIAQLPLAQRLALGQAIDRTAANTGLTLNLALNYGGRTEILDAVKKIALAVREGTLDLDTLSEEKFASYLYTAGIPDPDLLIRTSGEMRLSNFLPWQTSYTELYITDTLWPDFDQNSFLDAVTDYQKRERRFGSV